VITIRGVHSPVRRPRPPETAPDRVAIEAAAAEARIIAAAGAGNIAWLLLQAVGTSPGRPGQTTWIQRLSAIGGVAPAGMYTPGATTAVPYSADYSFWRDAAWSEVITDTGDVVLTCHLTLVYGTPVSEPTRTNPYGPCELLQLPSGRAELNCHYSLL
jgi:Protein of unknown function (DUF3455)